MTFRTVLRCGLAAALLAAGATRGAGAPQMTDFVGEDADIIVRVRSLQDLRENWSGHPLEQVWNQPELQEAVAALVAEASGNGESSLMQVLADEFDLGADELAELFSGEVGLAISGIGRAIADNSEPGFMLVADYGGEPERLHELMQIQFERNARAHREANPEARNTLVKERFMGETLYLDEAFDGEDGYIEDGYALVDGKFVLAAPEERLRLAVEGIKKGIDDRLVEKDNFVALSDPALRGDLLLFVDLETLLPPLLDKLRAQLGQSGIAALGITPEALLSALGLEAFTAGLFASDLEPDRLLFHSAVGIEGDRGLAGLVAYREGTLPEPGLIPREPISAGSARFDISAALAALEGIVNGVSPFYGNLFDSQLKNASDSSGVDLRRALLENFGSEIVSFAVFDPAAGATPTVDDIGQVFAVEVRDGRSLEAAIETLKGQVPGLAGRVEQSEFEGTRIYNFPGSVAGSTAGAQPQDFCYAVTRTHLVVCTGRVSMLREALARAAGGGGGFWERADIRTAFGDIARPRRVSRSYTDVEAFYGSMIATLSAAFEGLGGAGLAPDRSDLLPADLELPFFVVAETNLVDGGIVSRGQLLAKEGRLRAGEDDD